MTLETGAADASWLTWHSNFSPVMNINSNIDNQQGNLDGNSTGLLEDFTIVQQADHRSGVVFACQSQKLWVYQHIQASQLRVSAQACHISQSQILPESSEPV
jgi:hypothetical protein